MELVTNTERKLTNFESGNQEVPKTIKYICNIVVVVIVVVVVMAVVVVAVKCKSTKHSVCNYKIVVTLYTSDTCFVSGT